MKTTDLARFIVDLPSLPPTFIARDGRAVTPEEVAKWMITTGWTLGDGAKCVAPRAAPGVKPAVTIDGMVERLRTSPTFPPVTVLADGRSVTPEEVAGWCVLGANAYRQGEPDSGYRDFAKAYAKGTRGPPPSNEALAGALGDLPPFPPVTIVADGRVVTPEEVAAWAFLSNGAYRKGEIESGYDPTRSEERPATATGGRQPGLLEALPPRFEAIPPFPPVTLTADARTLTPPKLPPGVVCYMDPPYLDTTGYKHDLPRAEVVRMARLWADAGATVCISEAEAIPELMADGWHAVEISATRKGQKRTFSKQQAEWLTLSRPPSFVPRETMSLFG